MIDSLKLILFDYLDQAISTSNVMITLLVSVIVSIIMGLIYGSMKCSLLKGAISFVLFEILLIIAFFPIRNRVHKARLNIIISTMSKIDTTQAKNDFKKYKISTWKQGLKHIENNPKEVGYYMKTADILADDRDYESAASLIEMGLDFIKKDPPPLPLSERLKGYYSHLKNRRKIDDNYRPVHEIK